MAVGITWDVFSAARTIGQLTNVFAALGGRLVRGWLWIQRFWSRWWMTINVNELLSILGDDLCWFQRWTGWTSVEIKVFLLIPTLC